MTTLPLPTFRPVPLSRFRDADGITAAGYLPDPDGRLWVCRGGAVEILPADDGAAIAEVLLQAAALHPQAGGEGAGRVQESKR